MEKKRSATAVDDRAVTHVHIINHTHWDREWFLTSEYTSRWIPALIDRLELLAAANPDFSYLFDGQTLVIEDLLAVAPDYEPRVRRLIEAGRLQVGPYYCQPDWRLTDGELLWRNLAYGLADTRRLGGTPPPGWLVDTFGHISQSPQIHRHFGIETLFVWRGVPVIEPYFRWRGADGSEVTAVNLFGGYRNLYGVTHAPAVAVTRLVKEVDRLKAFYPTPDIPLFDGYDLEDDPEDPLLFYRSQADVPDTLQLNESTPAQFAQLVAEKMAPISMSGELLSGKYGATFPGTLSARTYLKVMAYDTTRLLLDRVEPWAALAARTGRPYPAERYERWSRELLQNAVHDCICGVSIDLVHEKMAFSYRNLFGAMVADANESLTELSADFKAGAYALSSCPAAVEAWEVAAGRLWHVRSTGVAIAPMTDSWPVQAMEETNTHFEWQNDHYVAHVGADGVVHIGEAAVGEFVVSAEAGDTYSGVAGARLGALQPSGSLSLVARSDKHAEVAFTAHWEDGERWVTAVIRLQFDPSPVIRWQVDLDSRGSDWRVEMVMAPGQTGPIKAQMPFTTVSRAVSDKDLLPRDLPPNLADVLLGQRELNETRTFPFQDAVTVGDGATAKTLLARGVHAYSVDDDGRLHLPLRRAVSWLTRADLPDRMGDAGPFFYVPDAAEERRISHHVAVCVGCAADKAAPDERWQRGFLRPAALIRIEGSGTRQSDRLFAEDVALSSLTVADGAIVARVFNPGAESRTLTKAYRKVSVDGREAGVVDALGAGEIVTITVGSAKGKGSGGPATVTWLNEPVWRVGDNAGLPQRAVLDKIAARIAALDGELKALVPPETTTTSAEARRQHRLYVLGRERAEMALTQLLNEQKLARNGALTTEALYGLNEAIATLGLRLNKLRIKRRIFDYVVQALPEQSE